MRNIYILKENNNICAFYYGENKSIYTQKVRNNQIFKEKIIDNCLNYFSVSLDKEGKIYIFNQDLDGNIILATSKNIDTDFNIFNLVQNENNTTNLTFLNPLFFENNISLIFNKNANNNSKNNFLSVKTMWENNKWSEAENIDIFSIGNSCIYEIENINEKDAILVYEKKDNELQLGFKEIIDGKISPFYQIHKTGFQIVDFSVLTVNEEVHFLYILKNLFSSQVVYRKKNSYGLTNPIVLFEGQKLRDCCIFLIENKIYCTCISGNSIIYSISNDFGNNFSNQMYYKKLVNQDIVKAKFLSKNNKEKSTILNHIYVDYKNPISVQFIPDILPDYINLKQYQPKSFIENENNFISDFSNQNLKNNTNIKNTSNLNQNTDTTKVLQNVNRAYKTTPIESDFMAHFNPEIFENILKNKKLNSNDESLKFNNEMNSEISSINEQDFIKNKLKIANEQIKEKDEQIIKLNSSIQNKQKQILDIELNFKEKIKKLEEENNKLKQSMKNESMKNERVDENVFENKDNFEKQEDKN